MRDTRRMVIEDGTINDHAFRKSANLARAHFEIS